MRSIKLKRSLSAATAAIMALSVLTGTAPGTLGKLVEDIGITASADTPFNGGSFTSGTGRLTVTDDTKMDGLNEINVSEIREVELFPSVATTKTFDMSTYENLETIILCDDGVKDSLKKITLPTNAESLVSIYVLASKEEEYEELFESKLADKVGNIVKPWVSKVGRFTFADPGNVVWNENGITLPEIKYDATQLSAVPQDAEDKTYLSANGKKIPANTPAGEDFTYTYKDSAGNTLTPDTNGKIKHDVDTITVTMTSNNPDYVVTSEIEKTFEIVGKPITPTLSLGKNAWNETEEWGYTGVAKDIGVTSDSNPGNGNVTYKYYTGEPEPADWSTVETTEQQPTGVGRHWVQATVAKSRNYASGTVVGNYVITRNDVEFTLPSPKSSIKPNTNATVFETLPTPPTGLTVEYYYKTYEEGDMEDSGEVLASSTAGLTLISGNKMSVDAGTYTIYAKVTPGDGYSYKGSLGDSYYRCGKLLVGDFASVSATAATGAKKTDDTALVTVTGEDINSEVKYIVASSEPDETAWKSASTDAPEANDTGIIIGKNKIWYKVTAAEGKTFDGTSTEKVGSVEVTVAGADRTVSITGVSTNNDGGQYWYSVDPNSKGEYNIPMGKHVKFTASAFDGGGELTYKIDDGGFTNESVLDKSFGKYSVTANLASDGVYNAVTSAAIKVNIIPNIKSDLFTNVEGIKEPELEVGGTALLKRNESGSAPSFEGYTVKYAAKKGESSTYPAADSDVWVTDPTTLKATEADIYRVWAGLFATSDSLPEVEPIRLSESYVKKSRLPQIYQDLL